MSRHLVWALVDLVAALLMVAVMVGAIDAGAWPLAIPAVALGTWCFVNACQDLTKWAES